MSPHYFWFGYDNLIVNDSIYPIGMLAYQSAHSTKHFGMDPHWLITLQIYQMTQTRKNWPEPNPPEGTQTIDF